jgi:phosphate transport system permease protein
VSAPPVALHGRRRGGEALFQLACLAAVLLPLLVLGWLLADTAWDGIPRLDWAFLTSLPSRKAEKAGLLPALVGSLWLVLLTAAIAVPVGVGAAIYLEEYGTRSRWARLVEVNIANLAGVPSILYGMLGLGVFVRLLGLGRSVLAGACTLALLVLPIVIMASREALRAVPEGLREAAAGLGATRWQITRQVVLPMALPGMLTGSILAVSRAIGETAPLIVVGAVAYVTFLPDGLLAGYSALPILIFNWVSRPQEAFVTNASAGILVLLVAMLVVNSGALWLLARLQRRMR